MLESLKVMHSRHTAGKPRGWTAQADWEETQAVLLATKQIERSIPIDHYSRNALLPE
jgi:hypothetical protein